LGPDNIHFGSSSFKYGQSSKENITYSYQSDQGQVVGEYQEDTNVIYSYNYNGENLESQYSKVTTTENGEQISVNGCNGWWDAQDIDLTDSKCTQAQWFISHCYIVDSLTGKQYQASEVNFSTLRGQSLLFGNWVCQSGVDSWEFDYDTCEWETISGTQTLLAFRNSRKAESGQQILA
jgi:hypothetical protein